MMRLSIAWSPMPMVHRIKSIKRPPYGARVAHDHRVPSQTRDEGGDRRGHFHGCGPEQQYLGQIMTMADWMKWLFQAMRWLFSFCLLLGLVQSGFAQHPRALVIGIDQYAPAGGYPASTPDWVSAIPRLNGCRNDALAMRAEVMARFGFASPDIDTLFNQSATRHAIPGGYATLAGGIPRVPLKVQPFEQADGKLVQVFRFGVASRLGVRICKGRAGIRVEP